MRVIIDVTQLAGWQGKLTGIPRVMYEVSKRYAVSEHEVHFLGWDEGRKIYWDLPLDTLYTKSGSANEDTGKENGKDVSIEPQDSLATKRSSYREYLRLIKASAKSTAKKMLKTEKDDHGFTFQPEDTFIVLWGEWGSQAYRDMIVDAVRNRGAKLYQFSYDMLPLVTPQYSSHSTEGLRQYCHEIYPLATRIIAISESTKRDVESWLASNDLDCPPIRVIRLGEDFSQQKERKPLHVMFESRLEYALCVGTIESRKNHTALYYAYKLAYSKGQELPTLVIVGRRGWRTDDIYNLMTADPVTKDKFVFLHDASDEELSWLYAHALFTVYPSHYEGWGLPIAESISFGTPCVASNSSSMPEIAGNLIQYFTPTSTDECLDAIIYLSDERNRKKAKELIKKYKPTTWDETVDQIRNYIESDND